MYGGNIKQYIDIATKHLLSARNCAIRVKITARWLHFPDVSFIGTGAAGN